MASIRGLGTCNRGGGIRGSPFLEITQFRSVSIIIAERRVIHHPKADDATEESINIVLASTKGVT
jgi:hypothetical protein